MVTSSNTVRPRAMMSRWPLVIGSNEPGIDGHGASAALAPPPRLERALARHPVQPVEAERWSPTRTSRVRARRPIVSGSARLWKCSATTTPSVVEQARPADLLEQRLVEVARVRRVEVDDVEAHAGVGQAGQRDPRVLAEDLRRRRRRRPAARAFARSAATAARALVDEHHPRRPARQRLEPDAAAARAGVEEAAARRCAGARMSNSVCARARRWAACASPARRLQPPALAAARR